MRPAADVQHAIREKMSGLRKAARASNPTATGTPSERRAKALKGFREWADLRIQAKKRAVAKVCFEKIVSTTFSQGLS